MSPTGVTPCNPGRDRSPVAPIADPDLAIALPTMFRNVHLADRFAVDIGGTLVKLAYSAPGYQSVPVGKFSPTPARSMGGVHLHFVKFETKHINQCLEFIERRLRPELRGRSIAATGGGSYKYMQLMKDKLKMDVTKEDEMACLISGCSLLLRGIADEAFTFHYHDEVNYRFETIDPRRIYPYMLVQIGSGVSVIKVEADGRFERVGGSALGGGSFWALGSLLTGCYSFENLLLLAAAGDHKNVDMLVSDIYGGSYENLGLAADIIASSFGKAVRKGDADEDPKTKSFAAADLARSLTLAISNSIGQMAVLYAQLHKIDRIYFGGFYIRGNALTMRTITFAVNYFSKGTIKALFLRHEGYLGAIGAFMKGHNGHGGVDGDNKEGERETNGGRDSPEEAGSRRMQRLMSWRENYAGTIPEAFSKQSSSNQASPMPSSPPEDMGSGAANFMPSPLPCGFEVLEFEGARFNLVPCRLLRDVRSYTVDTVDLIHDADARHYWLDCLEHHAEGVEAAAVASGDGAPECVALAASFRTKYLQHLRLLRLHPSIYGRLNVRSLLDLSSQILGEFEFYDIYKKQKDEETQACLASLPKILRQIDSCDTIDRRQALLAENVLAGNVFDWGAVNVVRMIKDGLSFDSAKGKVQDRPWLVDDLDRWIETRKSTQFKCACIFVDNAGADMVLGMLPLARDLIKSGTKVILCANSQPVLNDITADEMRTQVLPAAMQICPVIADALRTGMLLVADTGNSSPCLDFRRIDSKLDRLIKQEGVDLCIIEGMGRALHTNYNTQFAVATLKTAVIKDDWLARRLGGPVFSSIFKFEHPPDAYSGDSGSAGTSSDTPIELTPRETPRGSVGL